MSSQSGLPPLLLPAKFLRPRPAGHIVARARLLARLNENLERPLTLICAPAGYGKTTLAMQWLQSLPTAPSDRDGRTQPADSVWLSLDEKDNDLRRLLAHVIGAIQTVHPQACTDSLALLSAQGTVPQEQLTLVLIQELCRLSGPRLFLVLDDYYVIRQGEVHVVLAELIRSLPSHLHLVLISRMDPAIPLARLRLGGLITEIRARDLRFTLDETHDFFARAMTLKLSNRQVENLATLCEGWAAGLQTAVLSLREGADLNGVVCQVVCKS
ncbi:MAG: AAA family ATPase [Caldilineaceae bacterium]|nr:AAA family ATPase [Caldilineaceae bacterium]